MSWDFTEANIFGDAAGDFQRCIGSLTEVLDVLPAKDAGTVSQIDATAVVEPGRPARCLHRSVHITTTLVMPICLISSTFGCAKKLTRALPRIFLVLC